MARFNLSTTYKSVGLCRHTRILIQNDKNKIRILVLCIFANDIITDNEWNYRTWTRFLKTDSVQGASCYFLLANPSSEFIFPGVVAVVPIFGN